MPQQVKKLVAVLATFISMTKKKTKEKLKQVPCIQYLITFKEQTEVLLDLRNKVNAISQVFTYQLGLKTWKTNI